MHAWLIAISNNLCDKCSKVVEHGFTHFSTDLPMTFSLTDDALINAPRSQVLAVGSSGSLICSYPGGQTTYRLNNSIFDGSFSNANYSDSGDYTCDINVPSVGADIMVEVTLRIVGMLL